MPDMSEQDAFDIETTGGEPLSDSTNHGWGFELSVMKREIELNQKWTECMHELRGEVKLLIEERTGEYDEDDEETLCLAGAMLDAVMSLRVVSGSIFKRMGEIADEMCKSRSICLSEYEENGQLRFDLD
jgi:hypothetical protein